MKKFLLIIFALVTFIYLTGCTKKQQMQEEAMEPMSIEALSTLETKAPAMPETKINSVQISTPAVPSTTPYKPTALEIQTALKNVGYYIGDIDGKIGPLTRRATEDFQKANGLEVDGKVGPKTWGLLSAYLNPQTPTQTKKR